MSVGSYGLPLLEKNPGNKVTQRAYAFSVGELRCGCFNFVVAKVWPYTDRFCLIQFCSLVCLAAAMA